MADSIHSGRFREHVNRLIHLRRTRAYGAPSARTDPIHAPAEVDHRGHRQCRRTGASRLLHTESRFYSAEAALVRMISRDSTDRRLRTACVVYGCRVTEVQDSEVAVAHTVGYLTRVNPH